MSHFNFEPAQPTHRSVASYLAAVALADDVERGGRPVNRVMAWLCGPDGGIVEPLRELSAWLSVLSLRARIALIDKDPLGCLQYGDAEGFTPSDKRALLRSLKRHALDFPGFRYAGREWSDIASARHLAPLGCPALLPDLTAALTDPARDDGHQAFLDCVLDAVQRGSGMAPLLAHLVAIFRDAGHCEDIRVAALDTWIAHAGPGLGAGKKWLDELVSGALDDPSDRLLGRLLRALYPAHLTPREVVGVLRPPKSRHHYGSCDVFWTEEVVALTARDHVAELADAMAHRVFDDGSMDRERIHHEFPIDAFVGKLLPAALEASGEQVETSRLARWLMLAVDKYGHSQLDDREEAASIRDWLTRHPEIMWKVFRHRLEALATSAHAAGGVWWWKAEALLHGANRPADWHRRMLALADILGDERFAEWCLLSAWSTTLPPASAPFAERRALQQWVADHARRWPDAPSWLRAFARERRKNRRADRNRKAKTAARREGELRKRRVSVATQLEGLRSGKSTTPDFLGFLANIAAGRQLGAEGDQPLNRLQSYFGDADDAGRAMVAIRSSLEREDLPDEDAVVSAYQNNKSFHLANACLLAAEWEFRDDPQVVTRWPNNWIERLLAFHWVGVGNRPDWLTAVAAHRPDLVADCLCRMAIPFLADPIVTTQRMLSDLARDDAFAAVARRCLPPLLVAFPTWTRLNQSLWFAGTLLNAALKHMPEDEMLALAKQRALAVGMDSTQRMAWSLVAARAAPRQRLNDLARHLGSSRPRLLRLAVLLDGQRMGLRLELPVAAWSRLIALLGPTASPERNVGAGWVGPAERRRDVVAGMIGAIESSADDGSADDELSHLIALPALSAWHRRLAHARYSHRRLLRNTRYVYPDARRIADALAGGPPAGPQDLAALVCHLLQDLQTDLRHVEGKGWEVYWRTTDDGACVPRPENFCRNRLLESLKPRLASNGVIARPEDQQADDTRADVGLWVQLDRTAFRLPLEAKCEDEARVWTAWSDQLEGYARDRQAQDFGIYLVFWFGLNPRPHPNTRQKPTSAQEMREMLVHDIPATDRARLSVFVLDLTPPVPQKTRRRGRKAQRA